MGYAAMYVVASDPQFRERVRMAVIDVAKDVYNENPAVVGHVARRRFASEVARFSERWVESFSFVIAGVYALQVDATDPAIKAAVLGVFDAVAGV